VFLEIPTGFIVLKYRTSFLDIPFGCRNNTNYTTTIRELAEWPNCDLDTLWVLLALIVADAVQILIRDLSG
jgi:hypothetical protein